MKNLSIQSKYLILRYLLIRKVIVFLAFYEYLNRLIQETGPEENTTDFSYDPVGNRANTTVDAANRLLEDAVYLYTYDANGNLIRKVRKTNGETTTFSYDFENRLIKAEMPNSTIAQYKYDPFGRRLEKKVNTTIKSYLYDNEDILAEYDGSGVLTTKYTHGPGIDEPLAIERAGQSYYYHADGLGSIVALTDDKGRVVQTYEYDSFGNMKQHGHKVKQPYAFTGREYDSETKLYYYRARYYDPKIGRFTTKDLLNISKILLLKQNASTLASAGQIYNLALRNPQMLNEYLYAINNPLIYTDPFGEMSQIVGGVIAIGGTGALIGFTACMDNCIGGIRECQQRTEPMTSAQMQNYAKCAKTCVSPIKLWAFLIEPLGAIITTVIEEINH